MGLYSMMGSRRARAAVPMSSCIVLQLALVAAVSMYCGSAQHEAQAASLAVINLSLVPVNVSASVNASGSSVVAGALASVSLPIVGSAGLNVAANITVTNLLDNASITAPITVNASTTLLILPSLVPGRVTVALGRLLGGLLTAISQILASLL